MTTFLSVIFTSWRHRPLSLYALPICFVWYAWTVKHCHTPRVKGKGVPLQAWAGPWGSGRLRLRIFSTFGTMKVVRSSSLRTGRLYPQEFSWYSFLEAESTPGHMVPSVALEKIPSDITGDRSRDPPTSSVVPSQRLLEKHNYYRRISHYRNKNTLKTDIIGYRISERGSLKSHDGWNKLSRWTPLTTCK
jgi:hypothetical protein